MNLYIDNLILFYNIKTSICNNKNKDHISFKEAAYYYCENLTKSNYENFPVASFFIPKSKRSSIYAIYAFARTADNIADSPHLPPHIKIEKLELMEELLNVLPGGDRLDIHFRHVFTALHDTLEKTNIERDDLRALLKAFRQDVNKNRYDNFQELLDYAKFSANPVGHLILELFGYEKTKDSRMFELSDKICTALQFANFWQDVLPDLNINRIYIPLKNMAENEYDINDLFARVESDHFKRLMKQLLDDTEIMFEDGRELIKYLHGMLRKEIAATIMGGMKVLERIRKNNYKVMSHRVKLSKGDKMGILLRVVFS